MPNSSHLRLSIALTGLVSWASMSPAQPCTQGPQTVACLEVNNDRNAGREGEVASSAIPVAQSAGLLSTAGLELLDEAGAPVPAQFRPVARWGSVVDDGTKPIRWLEVSIQDTFTPQTLHGYRLRTTPSPAPTPNPLTVTDQGGSYRIETGTATFTVDPGNPALLQRVDLGASTVFTHSPGAGPRLQLPGLTLDTGTPGEIVIDPGSFAVLEQGPIRATFAIQAHFVDPAGAPGSATLCDDFEPEVPAYESMAYTLVLILTRGTSHADLQLNFRNECLDPAFGPFTATAETVDRLSWELPLGLGGPLTTYYGGSGALASGAGDAQVEQRKGSGTPWRRRGRVQFDGSVVATGETVDRPFVGVGNAATVVAAQMPWMRFREPQALAVEGSTLSLRFIGTSLVVGGGKGIWNLARLSFLPGSMSGLNALEALRSDNEAALERGLLVRAARPDINRAAVFPSLGTDAPSLVKSEYAAFLSRWHDDTVGAGGQHELAKTFGSQLWPDTQGATWPNAESTIGPTDNPGGLNYWNTARAELLEFLRTGDPQWSWELALPLVWQQIFSAYANLGENGDGFKNGYALTSPACDFASNLCAEGQWYRYSGGSDDYTYTFGNLAYVLRPSYPLLRRFAQAGATTLGRYNVPRAQQAQRQPSVNEVDLTRQVVQHFVQLANCAEFVPGAEGQACHDGLMAILTELSEENLSSGLMCQGDVQPASPSRCMPDGGNPALDWCDCAMPQQFMLNSLMIPFLTRLYLNYGDVGGNLRTALAMTPWHLYRAGIAIPAGQAPASPADPARPQIPVNPPADWYGQPGWDLGTTPYTVQDVDVIDNDPNTPDVGTDEGNVVLEPNKPQTVAQLLLAHATDPSLDLCTVSRTALDSAFFLDAWDEYEFSGGWLKGPAQVMQGMVFGVGLYDECSASLPLFEDGFESGNTAAWSFAVP